MRSFSEIRQAVAGWVYPPVCAVCDEPLDVENQLAAPFLCRSCESSMEPIGGHYCPVCGQTYETPGPLTMKCGNCGDRELAIDFAVSSYRSTGVARELMHAFKYRKQQHLSRLMGAMIHRVWSDERLHRSSWCVVPVPLHPRRRRYRGFNQSEEIAKEMIRRAPEGIHFQLVRGLRRTRHTRRQADLDRRDRLKNLAEAFEPVRALQGLRPRPPRILIVDDVITTGTTVSECAAAIRALGDFEAIAAVSVMRG